VDGRAFCKTRESKLYNNVGQSGDINGQFHVQKINENLCVPYNGEVYVNYFIFDSRKVLEKKDLLIIFAPHLRKSKRSSA
jgi:hypothetical protein